MTEIREAKFLIGQIVKHRIFPFRGVIFDVDPTFNNTEEWYQSIPAEIRPRTCRRSQRMRSPSGAEAGSPKRVIARCQR